MSDTAIGIDMRAKDNASRQMKLVSDRLVELRQETDKLRAKGAINLTVADSGNLRRLTGEANALERQLASLKTTGTNAATSMNSSFSGLSSALSGAGLGGLVGLASAAGIGAAAAGVAKFAVELGGLGAQAITTEKSYSAVLRSIGQTPALLNELSAAAGGTISQMRLMQLSNTALAGASDELGNAFAGALPKLIEGARAANQLNPALGDTEFLFQSLVTGIKRGSPMLIDNTGITLKLGEANERYAESLGKTASQLTEEEQKLALLQATMEGVDRLVMQAGGNLDNLTTNAQRATASWANLRAEFGKSLAGPVSEGQGFLAGMFDSMIENLRLGSSEMVNYTVASRKLEAATQRMEQAQTGYTNAVAWGDDVLAEYYQQLIAEENVLLSTAQAQLDAANAIIYTAQVADAAIGAVSGLAGAFADLNAASGGVTTSPWAFTSASSMAEYAKAMRPDTQADAASSWIKRQQTALDKANTASAKSYQSAMEAAGRAAASKIQGYLSEGINFSKGLDDLTGGQGGLAPGKNGAFEDIYRLQAWLNDGSWGDVGQKFAGGDKEKARKIVEDFQNNIFSADVIGAIDVDALAKQAGMAAFADKTREAFVQSIANNAGTSTSVVDTLLGFKADDKGNMPGDAAAQNAMNALASSVGAQVKGKDFAGKMIGYGETIWGYTEAGMIGKAKTSTAFQAAIDAMVNAAIAAALGGP